MKTYFILPALFLFLGCSLIAKPVEEGELTPSTWYGYYNFNEVPDFNNLSFFQFKIEESFISIKSGNYSLETGEPQQTSASIYKITKILKDTPEEYQVLIVDTLTDSPVERILGLKRIDTDIFISEPVLWEEDINKRSLNYKDYLFSETYVDQPSVDPMILDPSEVVLFDTFLEKMTGGKDKETWELTPIVKEIAGSTLKIIGMDVGSKITIFKECVKNADGTPYEDKNKQKVWGYAHGKEIALFPWQKPKPYDYAIYYTPIPTADSENKYGIYWFQGNSLFGNRAIEIPVMIHESKGINNAFSGVVNGFTATKPWDAEEHWIYLDKYSLDTIMKNNNFIKRSTPIE